METQRCSVKVVEVCRVSPPPTRPDSVAPESLPLTFFDILWLRFPHVTRLFFYELTETDLFYDSIVPKLKNSLSRSLSHYLPLAGHLVWPENSSKPVIQYLNGDGVSFAVAESDGSDFNALSGDHSSFRAAAELHPLIPKLASSRDRAEAVAIQVTLFPGSGFCVGMASHHAILDGKTSTSFVKSWAKTCLQSSLSESPVVLEDRPFYDRTVIGDPAGLESIYANAWLNEDGERENKSLQTWELGLTPGSVRATFELSREKIEKLKKSAQVSTYSIVASYVSVCAAKAATTTRGEDNIPAMTYLSILADFRARLSPAIPAEYFGNCVIGRGLPVETRALSGENGMSAALEAIGRAVKSFEDGKEALKGTESLASVMIAGRAKLSRPSVGDSDGDGKRRDSVMVISFVGSPRFGVYGTDFGFGRPKKVEMSSIDKTGAICLSDSKNGDGGVEIGLVLKLKEMEAFAFEFVKGLENI